MKQTILYRSINYAIRFCKETYRTKYWTTKYNKHYSKILNLKNKHLNKPCIVIGNGPSLNKMDLNKFKSHVTIACNSFYLKHDELEYTPTYYTVEDPLPAIDNSKEISDLKGTTKIIPYDLKNVIDEDENTIYVNFLRSYARPTNHNFPFFAKDFSLKSYWGGTVAYMNIQLAHYLGCNPIYLIGVDLTYKIPDNIKKEGTVYISLEDDPNHFHPNYFGKGKKWHIPEVSRMQSSFSKAYDVLNKEGIELINATIGGNLKGLPREEL